MTRAANSKSKATRAARESEVFEMRKGGATFEKIGAALGVTAQRAHQIFERKLLEVRTKTGQTAEQLRALEMQRLDDLQSFLWEKARKGNATAIDRILKIMERRARLEGLDAPQRIGLGGDPDAPPIKQETRSAAEFTDDELAAVAASGGR
ncbi:hypothetical protein [Methyloversatilis sp. XJ19-49]|jgi:outer membrane PBP1 activator LpoA protein|uniref:hypothetical protein n=1 Tax=Methyloversatilis sp. XJ19-49 TaxID=2963429 RepID=UPI00211BC0C8|nr:hypothetical protein [Methyloversatilis sp. XJ19-49]MCQ9378820.1 hypothetical protein [Methyloversatilis sp. XJ19-49]